MLDDINQSPDALVVWDDHLQDLLSVAAQLPEIHPSTFKMESPAYVYLIKIGGELGRGGLGYVGRSDTDYRVFQHVKLAREYPSMTEAERDDVQNRSLTETLVAALDSGLPVSHHVMFWCDSTEHSKATEIEVIAAIGRKWLGQGPLLNITAGGDGWDSACVKAHRARPEVKAHYAALFASAEYQAKKIALGKEIMGRPEVKAKRKATDARPEVKNRRSVSQKIAKANPEVRRRLSRAAAAVSNRPDVREKRSVSAKARCERDRLRRLNGELPLLPRDVVWKMLLEGKFSMEDMAAAVGWETGTVRSVMFELAKKQGQRLVRTRIDGQPSIYSLGPLFVGPRPLSKRKRIELLLEDGTQTLGSIAAMVQWHPETVRSVMYELSRLSGRRLVITGRDEDRIFRFAPAQQPKVA